MAIGVERPKAAIRFEIGENVRVAGGRIRLASPTFCIVDEFYRVEFRTCFGRATPVDLEFGQVEKQ